MGQFRWRCPRQPIQRLAEASSVSPGQISRVSFQAFAGEYALVHGGNEIRLRREIRARPDRRADQLRFPENSAPIPSAGKLSVTPVWASRRAADPVVVLRV